MLLFLRESLKRHLWDSTYFLKVLQNVWNPKFILVNTTSTANYFWKGWPGHREGGCQRCQSLICQHASQIIQSTWPNINHYRLQVAPSACLCYSATTLVQPESLQAPSSGIAPTLPLIHACTIRCIIIHPERICQYQQDQQIEPFKAKESISCLSLACFWWFQASLTVYNCTPDS